MNPGPVEEAGKAAGTFMDIMRGQPIALSLCVMNILLLGLMWFVISTATEVRHKEMDRIFAAQEKTNQLLFNCVPSKPLGFRLQSEESRPVELDPETGQIKEKSDGDDDRSIHK